MLTHIKIDDTGWFAHKSRRAKSPAYLRRMLKTHLEYGHDGSWFSVDYNCRACKELLRKIELAELSNSSTV